MIFFKQRKIPVATGGKGGLGNVRFKSSTNELQKKTSGKSGENFGFYN